MRAALRWLKSRLSPATRLKLRSAVWELSRRLRFACYRFFPDPQIMQRLREAAPKKILAIEVINICNANCVFCGYQYQERRKQAMSDEVFEKSLRDYVEMGGGELSLTVTVGEPLLDPKFVQKVARARSEPRISNIFTITNCLNLHRVGARNLLTSGISWIDVSTTAFDAETYSRVYRSSHFEQMKANLLELLRTNHALGRPAKINVRLRLDRPPEEALTLPGFEEVKRLADSVDWNTTNFDSWSGRIKQQDLPGQMKLRRPTPLFLMKGAPCAMLWNGLTVLSNGTVTACACRDLDGTSQLVLGNIRERSLRELWHSERLRDIRQDWFARRHIPDICRDCTLYRSYAMWMCKEWRNEMLAGDPAPGQHAAIQTAK